MWYNKVIIDESPAGIAVTLFPAPEAPTEPTEPEIVRRCARCQGDIYEGEVWGERNGLCLCPDCVDSVWDELSAESKLRCLGYTPASVR